MLQRNITTDAVPTSHSRVHLHKDETALHRYMCDQSVVSQGREDADMVAGSTIAGGPIATIALQMLSWHLSDRRRTKRPAVSHTAQY
jgi:hypothetical protein